MMIAMQSGTKSDGRGVSSVPGTPQGTRRAMNMTVVPGTSNYINNNVCDNSRGGSLERRFQQQQQQQYPSELCGAWSDTEYGRLLGSPMSSRRNPGGNGHQRDPVFGSRSLPKGASSSLNYGLMMDRIQQKRRPQTNQQQHQRTTTDGSVSDSNAYASFMQPATTYANSQNQHQIGDSLWNQEEVATNLSSATNEFMGSNESLNSVSSSIQQARANSLTKARLMMHQRSIANGVSPSSPRNRQNQVGTAGLGSEHSFSSNATSSRMTNDETDYYGIVPFRAMASNNTESIGIARFKSHPTSPPKGHAADSIETAAAKEKQTDDDIKKLRKELLDEHEKVQNLTSQLTTNAHVVAAFEQSLANMTSRLQQLTATAEKKDVELTDLRRTIELLRQSGKEVGLIGGNKNRQTMKSNDSLASNSGDESGAAKGSNKGIPKRSGWLRNSFNKAFSRSGSKTSKNGSMSDYEDGSIVQRMYNNDHGRHPQQPPVGEARCASATSGCVTDQLHFDNVALQQHQQHPPPKVIPVPNIVDPNLVSELKRQLMEKDSLLTETRLEALSSAHQLESLRETVTKMRSELITLKTDNEKLHQTIVHNQSVNSSQTSLEQHNDETCDINVGRSEADADEDDKRRCSEALSEVESVLSGPSSLDLSGSTDPTNKDGGKLVTVSVWQNDEQEIRLG